MGFHDLQKSHTNDAERHLSRKGYWVCACGPLVLNLPISGPFPGAQDVEKDTTLHEVVLYRELASDSVYVCKLKWTVLHNDEQPPSGISEFYITTEDALNIFFGLFVTISLTEREIRVWAPPSIKPDED
ncbi:MAG TPA: hypothetical protein DEP63_02995 [Candidatus Magasanikbacteria bacterium]|nr:hypothetical protein [Candidatus Magasanikbacteria bacterium]HCC13689.1 hypothetical protein [Candidatus Magasanikbacteria bacterium]